MNDKRYFNCPKPNEWFNTVALGQRIQMLNAKLPALLACPITTIIIIIIAKCLEHTEAPFFFCCLCFHRAFEIFPNDNYIEHDWFLFTIANQWELSISKIAKEESFTWNYYSWYFWIHSEWKMNRKKTIFILPVNVF